MEILRAIVWRVNRGLAGVYGASEKRMERVVRGGRHAVTLSQLEASSFGLEFQMSIVTRRWPGALSIAAAAMAMAMSGCGGGAGSGSFGGPSISVALSSSTVVVASDGTPTYIQIRIQSTSETALVSFVGIPAGVQVIYQASDTNPSGLLTFKATGKVKAGTSMPVVTVNSAGQTAMANFTLIVPDASPP